VNETFYVEGYFDQVNFTNCHNLFKDDLQRFKISVLVEAPAPVEAAKCTYELLSPTESTPYVITFNSTDDEDQVISLNQIKGFFGNNLTCPMTSASLYKDSLDEALDATLSEIVSIDPVTLLTTIKNNVTTNQTFDFVIKAKTDAFAVGYKAV
jgi:hypothetical protein